MYMTIKRGAPFALGGLWDVGKSPDGEHIRSCTIITTEPNDLVPPIHTRMPAILLPGAYADWLDPDMRDEQALSHWLAPYPAEEMTARPVSRLVNDPKRDSPELMAYARFSPVILSAAKDLARWGNWIPPLR